VSGLAPLERYEAADFIIEAIGQWHQAVTLDDRPLKLLVIDQQAGQKSNVVCVSSSLPVDARRLDKTMRAAGPPLLFGLRMWVSVSLALYVAFWLELDNAFWAGTTAAIVCQPRLGASLRKGSFRMQTGA
jgi:hypothetical protein